MSSGTGAGARSSAEPRAAKDVHARDAASGPGRALGPWLRWAAFAALVVLSVLALRRLDARALRRALAGADPVLLLAAAGTSLGTLALQAARWLAILRPVARARARDAFFALVAGYAVGLVVPARASDLARAHILARRTGAPTAALAATTLVDHLLSSMALLALFGLVAGLAPLPAWMRSAGTGALVLTAVALGALWIVHPRGDGGSRRGERLLGRLRLGLAAVGRPRSLALAWACATSSWLGQCFVAWLALRAFGLPATPATSLLVVLATMLSAAASLSPGNAGTFEAACVLALASAGVGREPALAFSLGYHAAQLLPVAIVGGGWLVLRGPRGGRLREAP